MGINLKLLFILNTLALHYLSLSNIDVIKPISDYDYNDHIVHSGYLNIDNNRKLHYVLAESQQNPAADPLVFWFNGGPGCSSMMGFLVEHGPMVFEDGELKLRRNPYPWNQKANMAYIESPYGVGFSAAKDYEDLSSDDIRSAQTNLQAILSFYEKYPELKQNELYITGESFAGIYVPHLVKAILDYNKLPNIKFALNLKGFIAGNAMTDWLSEHNGKYAIQFAIDRDLISPEIKKQFYANNCIDFPEKTFCKNLIDEANNNLGRIFSTNIYGKCFKDKQDEEECNGEYGMLNFLNRQEVKAMLNVDKNVSWIACNPLVKKSYVMNKGSLYLYGDLINSGLKIIIYSGDTDSYVSINGTKAWLKKLNLQYETTTFKWPTKENYFSGYFVKYNGLTFITIANGGHQVGQYKRREALQILNHLIHGTDL